MSKQLITSATRGQIVEFLEGSLDNVSLDGRLARRIIGRSDELQLGMENLITGLLISNRYEDEEVYSSSHYLSGYTRPLPLDDQVKRLRELFPALAEATFDEGVATCELPANAEGYFAIPNWQKLASTYGEAVQQVLDAIKQTRNGKFYNYREGRLSPQYLRQHVRTMERFQQLTEQQQGHGILVVPAQFGFCHRGRSMRRAREVMVKEFPLGAFHIGVMLLTHPDRLQDFNDLCVDCSGDDYAPDDDGVFHEAPYFRFGGGGIAFDTVTVSRASSSRGSASALFSQH